MRAFCPLIRGNHESEGDKAGLVLVEVAMAIFVFAVGVLALVVLLNSSAERAGRAHADTRRALFAQSVFQGLRAVSFAAREQGRWTNFWFDFSDGYTNIAVSAPGAWSTNLSIAGYGLQTNVFRASSQFLFSHALRYRLDVDPDTDPRRVSVLLTVWEGEFGQTDEGGKPFYTEFHERPRL
jgi:Tfp pilus assembly protein PilV